MRVKNRVELDGNLPSNSILTRRGNNVVLEGVFVIIFPCGGRILSNLGRLIQSSSEA